MKTFKVFHRFAVPEALFPALLIPVRTEAGSPIGKGSPPTRGFFVIEKQIPNAC